MNRQGWCNLMFTGMAGMLSALIAKASPIAAYMGSAAILLVSTAVVMRIDGRERRKS